MTRHRSPRDLTKPAAGYLRGRYSHRRWRVVLASVVAVISLLVASAVVLKSPWYSRPKRNASELGARTLPEPIDSDAFEEISAEVAPSASRRIFRHSVVDGGVYSASELLDASQRDAMVATHYADLSMHAARLKRVKKSRMVYMSYRIRDRVYWTKNRLALRAGETVLDDGENLIRTRCGNRISDRPQTPTAAVEPAWHEFDEEQPGEHPGGTESESSPAAAPVGPLPRPFLPFGAPLASVPAAVGTWTSGAAGGGLGGTSGGSAAASDHGLTPVPLIPDISAANIFGPDVRGPLTGGPGGIDDSILFPTPGDSIVPPFVPGADLPPSGHPPVVGSNPPVVAPPEVNPPDLIPPGVAPLIPPSASKPVHQVPEPEALLLFGTGLAIAGWKLRSRR